MSAGSPISTARRVRFIGDPQSAHRGRLPAHPALFPLPCRLWRRRPSRCRGARRLHRRPRRARAALARARAHGADEAGAGAARDAGADRHERCRAAHARAGRRRLSRRLREHGQGRGGAPACRPTRCAGWARSASRSRKMPSGCGRSCGSPTASTSGCRRWARAGGSIAPATASRRRALCSIGSSASATPTACCWPGRARKAPRMTRLGARSRRLPQRWTPPVFPLQGRRLHRARRREGPGARRRFARGGGGVDRGGVSGRGGGA